MSQSQSSLFPTYARFPLTLVKGKGSWLWDDQGKQYLDFMSGLAVTNLGHAPDRVKEKLVAQLDQLWHISNLFHIPEQERAARLLTDNSCADAVFFCNSGAEANEAAIKLARRYHQTVLQSGRYEIITFRQSFHGRTLATLTATGQEKIQEGFSPLPDGFVYAPYNHANELSSFVNDKTCAIMLELVQGEGGVHEADESFVREVVRLCREHGLLLIIDEIQTGMGRTGKWFAYEHYGIEPDIFTLAKGLGSGFPVGAMLAKSELASAFGAGSHGSTFGGTPLASTAAAATIETMLAERAVEHAAEMGELLMSKLTEQLSGNAFVREIRGKGLIIGIECAGLVADAIAELRDEGLLVVPAGPQVIRLLPNLLVTHEEIESGVKMLASVLAKRDASVVS